MLVLSYNYQPEQGPRLMNYYPLIPEFNYKIEGTHLFTNHSNSIIPWNIEIKPFTQEEYQFKGELCNTGYKIYEFDKRQCALLIDTQLSDNLIKLNARNMMAKREAKRDYEKKHEESNFKWMKWGKEKNFEPALNNTLASLFIKL